MLHHCVSLGTAPHQQGSRQSGFWLLAKKDNTLLTASSGDRVGQSVGITVSIGTDVGVACGIAGPDGDRIGVHVEVSD